MGRLAEGQRKLLEQLMGPEAMGILVVDLKLTDAKVCKNFSCGICPHDLFSNTRMDLGTCPHSHSAKLKAEYEASLATVIDSTSTAEVKYTQHDLLGIRNEYERNISSFVEDCDRRIRAAQRRLEKTPEENNKTTSLMRDIGEVQAAYDSIMAEVEALGSSGQVDESMAELAKAEALKAEKMEKERELQSLTESAGASGHQKLRVCDICGAYLSILDSDRRLADHFGGKMHLGYLQLRTMIDEWRERGPDQQPGRANRLTAPAPVEEAPIVGTVPKSEDKEDGEVPTNGDVSMNGAAPEVLVKSENDTKSSAHREDTEMLPPSTSRHSPERKRERSHDAREERRSGEERRSDRDRERDRERSDRDRGDRDRDSRSDRHRSERSDRDRERDRSDRDRSDRGEERRSGRESGDRERSSRRREHDGDESKDKEREEKRRRYD